MPGRRGGAEDSLPVRGAILDLRCRIPLVARAPVAKARSSCDETEDDSRIGAVPFWKRAELISTAFRITRRAFATRWANPRGARDTGVARRSYAQPFSYPP